MAQPAAVDFHQYSDLELDSEVLSTLDADLASLAAFIATVRTNLAAIQRDDTALANGSVHALAMSTEALALFAAAWSPQGGWLTGTDYAVRDVVTESGDTYLCVIDHTAGTFATDLAAGKWMALTGASASAASAAAAASSASDASDSADAAAASAAAASGANAYLAGIRTVAADTDSQAADTGKRVDINKATAVALTVKVDTHAALSIFYVKQVGAGQVTIGMDAGVTLNVPSGYQAKTAGQGAVVTIMCDDATAGANVFTLAGNLALSS